MTAYAPDTNGMRKQGEASSAKQSAAAVSTSRDIQSDLQELQKDVAKLSQQLAGLVSAKGNETWKLAKESIDGVLSTATDKGKEATDAVTDVRDTLAAAITESVEKRPYATLAMTLAAGFLFGAMWEAVIEAATVHRRVMSMLDGFVRTSLLKAKAATGVNEELFLWSFVAAVLTVFALVFFSVAGFIWLAGIFGGAAAALITAGVHLLIVAILVARCVVVRRNTKRMAHIELAAQQKALTLDPRYLAVGVEVVKTIGLRNILPFAAAAVVAIGWNIARDKAARSPHA